MKSPDPLDVVRLEVGEVAVRISPDREEVTVDVRFRYAPWEPSRAQDQFFEQANALECVRLMLQRGGLTSDW